MRGKRSTRYMVTALYNSYHLHLKTSSSSTTGALTGIMFNVSSFTDVVGRCRYNSMYGVPLARSSSQYHSLNVVFPARTVYVTFRALSRICAS